MGAEHGSRVNNLLGQLHQLVRHSKYKMTQKYSIFLPVLGFFLLLLAACEEDFEPPTIPGNRPDIVIDAYVEAYGGDLSPDDVGIVARPAYVVLTRSIPFGDSFNSDNFDDLFVHDAKVSISTVNDPRTIDLQEICLSSTQDSVLRAQIIGLTGLNSADFTQLGIDFNETDFCFYIDFGATAFEIGETFNLSIEVEERTFTATTTTPPIVPLSDIQFRLPPGDSAFFSQSRLRQMAVRASPPDSIDTFFRYFTQRNDDPMYKGNASISGFRSVLQGRVFGNGEEFIALPRGQARDSTFEVGGNRFGNYRTNDDYLVKWCTIDEAHFDYWNSTEFNALNQGFFSTYTQPQFNIEGEGAIGIFGGYSVAFYAGKVPRN